GPARLPGGASLHPRSCRLCLDRDDGDDLEGERIHDHQLVVEHEASEVPELRHDENDVLGDDEQMEAARHEDAHADDEVDVRHPQPGDEPALQDDVLDPRALLAGERNSMASRAGLSKRVSAALGLGCAGLGPAGGPQILAVRGLQILSPQILALQAALIGERLSAVHAVLGQRTTALAAQGSGLHPWAAGSEALAAHGVLRGESRAAAAERRAARLAAGAAREVGLTAPAARGAAPPA